MLQVTSATSEIYLKLRFASVQCKSILDQLKQVHHSVKTENKLGNVFRQEGLLVSCLTEKDKSIQLRLVRKEVASLSSNARGVSVEDCHPAVFNAVKSLLPS